MRATLRRLADAQPVAARYLVPGAPTGLAGLRANASPRTTLLYLYTQTLAKLAPVPATSVYRQSVEAVTKQRMAAVEAAVPAGHAAWAERALARFAAHNPDGAAPDPSVLLVPRRAPRQVDERDQEWDGAFDLDDSLEGPRTPKEAEEDGVDWEPEPQLTMEQIEALETKIGAGLIEEVIQVAEGELTLVDAMIQGKVWESLDEKPAEGQWEYFERKA